MILSQLSCCTNRVHALSQSSQSVRSTPSLPRTLLFAMTAAFDFDLEMGHLSGKSLEGAAMGTLTIADPISEHAFEEL